ncbi:MAG TPA: hypothetical protein VN798_18425 [Pseudomonas sp.]|nr:hypothetical protein [Pseudomonas sp.]
MWAGSTFVNLLERVTHAEDSARVAEKICKTLNVTMVLRGQD